MSSAVNDSLITGLCWVLYLFVALVLWLCVWRVAYVAVQRRPGRWQ